MALSFKDKIAYVNKFADKSDDKLQKVIKLSVNIDSPKLNLTDAQKDKIKSSLQTAFERIKKIEDEKTGTGKKPRQPNLMALTKQIQTKQGISFEDARAKAKQAFAAKKSGQTNAIQAVLQDFKKKVGKLAYSRATKGTDIKRDMERPALKEGKRKVTTQGYTTNKYGTFKNKVGSVYYENRANRIDINQPSKKRYPKLADGGGVSEKKYGIIETINHNGYNVKHFIDKSYDEDYWYFVYENTPFEYDSKEEAIKNLDSLTTKRKRADGGKMGYSRYNKGGAIEAKYKEGKAYGRSNPIGKRAVVPIQMDKNFSFYEYMQTMKKPTGFNVMGFKDGKSVKLNDAPVSKKEADKIYDQAKRNGYKEVQIEGVVFGDGGMTGSMQGLIVHLKAPRRNDDKYLYFEELEAAKKYVKTTNDKFQQLVVVDVPSQTIFMVENPRDEKYIDYRFKEINNSRILNKVYAKKLQEQSGNFPQPDTEMLDYYDSRISSEPTDESGSAVYPTFDDEYYKKGGKISSGTQAKAERDAKRLSKTKGKMYVFKREEGDEKGNYIAVTEEQMFEELNSPYKSTFVSFFGGGKKYAQGGMSEHGLKVGDKIEGGKVIGTTIRVRNENRDEYARVDLDKGERTTLVYDKKTKKYVEKMNDGGYVAVGEKDGYWTIISKPSSKENAQKMLDLGSLPRGEMGKVVTVEEAKAHKKVIGREYLAYGGKMKYSRKK